MIFSFSCFYAAYRLHCAIKKKLDDREARFNGEVPVYDPSDPETQAKMTDKEREYAEPGGPWELRDVNGRKFGSKNLRGQYYMLFFGHTLCPEATPLTVLKMTKAISIL